MIPPSCEVTSVRFISVQNTRVTRPLGALIPKMVLAVCCAMSSSSLTTWIMGELRAGGRAHARWHARVSVCVCARVCVFVYVCYVLFQIDYVVYGGAAGERKSTRKMACACKCVCVCLCATGKCCSFVASFKETELLHESIPTTFSAHCS